MHRSRVKFRKKREGNKLKGKKQSINPNLIYEYDCDANVISKFNI